MRTALLVALILAPLAASSLFSEFELSKWLTVGIAISVAAVLAWRQDIDGFLRQRKSLFMLIPAALGMAAISLIASWATDPQSAWIDSARLGLPLLLIPLVAFAWRDHSRSQALLVGALIPTGLTLCQLLLDYGFFPIDVPHLKGEWTATIGNGALVGEAALVLMGFLILWARSFEKTRGILLAVVAGIPTLLLVYISDSRAVWLGFLVFSLSLVILEATNRKKEDAGARSTPLLRILGILVGLLVLVILLAPENSLQTSFAKRVSSIVDPEHPTNIVRTELASDAISLWSQNKMIGVGGGRFGSEHNRVRQIREWSISGFSSRVDEPHNEYLRFLSEYGIFGSAIVIALAIGLIMSLWRRRSCEFARMALAIWIGVFLIATTWATFQHAATMIPLAFLTGLAFASNRSKTQATAGDFMPWRGSVLVGLIAVLTLGIVIWAERNSAATALRDRGELLKAEFAEASAAAAESPAQAEQSARVLGDLGIVGKSLSRVAESGWLRPTMRFRLLTTVSNLAEQNTALAMLRPDPKNVAGNMLLQAAKELPNLQDVRELSQFQLSRCPAHLSTLRLLGRTEMLASNKAAAVLAFEEVLDINPRDPFAHQLLAELYVEGSTGLYELAVGHLNAHIDVWGKNELASDASWQLKARCLGAVGRLNDALACVEEWTMALGDADRRRAIGGELSLYLGETENTVGSFLTDEVVWGERQERGTFMAGSFEGLPDVEMRTKLLAHLGRHPHDTPVLDRLQNVLFDLSQAVNDQDAQLERMRDRVIARARVHYAWEHHLRGDERNLRVCLRIAKRKAPKQNDPYFLEVFHAALADDLGKALEALKSWKSRGVHHFPALESHPQLASFVAEPEVQAIIRP